MADLPKTNALKIGSLDLRQAIRRLPFILFMVILLILVAWWTNSTFQELRREWVNRLGFTPRDLIFFRWERLIITFPPKPWRWLVFGAILVYLVVALVLPPSTGVSQAI
jgi:hypothetical protein